MKKFLIILILIFITAGCGIVDKSTDINAPINYAKYDLNDINAAQKATKEYQRKFKDKKGTKEAEEEFLRFWEFYCDFVLKHEDKAYKLPLYTKDGNFIMPEEHTKKFAKYGLLIQMDEGEYLMTHNNTYTYEQFAPYLNEAWQEELQFETRYDERIISDGRYIIPKEELIKILDFYKNFNKKYPSFILKDSIENLIKKYEEDIRHYPSLDY